MKIKETTIQKVTPPRTFTLELNEEELIRIWELSYFNECGDNFPTSQRLHEFVRSALGNSSTQSLQKRRRDLGNGKI